MENVTETDEQYAVRIATLTDEDLLNELMQSAWGAVENGKDINDGLRHEVLQRMSRK